MPKQGRRLSAAMLAAMAIALAAGLNPGGAQLVRADQAAATAPIAVVSITGIVNGPDADQVAAALGTPGLTMLVIELNSDGATADAMRRIVNAELEAQVPVVAYVGPGGHCLAGCLFALEGAAVSAAAPEVVIGAGHPLDAKGMTIAGIADGDAATILHELAGLHRRDGTWLAQAGSGSEITAAVARQRGAIDVVADSRDQLLTQLDNRALAVGAESVVVHTAGVATNSLVADQSSRLIAALATPDTAYVLLVIAALCLGIWIAHPAGILLGVVAMTGGAGAVAGFVNLPVNPVGIALILLGFGLFAVDLKAITHGALTAAGAAAMALGGWKLVDLGLLDHGVSAILVVISVGAISSAYGMLMPKLLEARRMPYSDHATELIGKVGTVREPLRPSGMVFVDGSLWRAISTQSPQQPGDQIRVVEVNGLRLTVEPIASPEPSSAPNS